MQRSLKIYPTLVVLTYLDFKDSLQSQQLCRQQRSFILSKLPLVHSHRPLTLNLVGDARFLIVLEKACILLNLATDIKLNVSDNE